jgi:cytochrome bd-type quinol oxidase subunit 2
MTAAVLLFLVPVGLFLLGFVYETYLSFRRLANHQAGRSGYVATTWEVTHTLLVVGLTMLFMMFTQAITGLASAIFMATFLAAVALVVRAICYTYIFYVRKGTKVGLVDWIFALSHIAAAVFLVATVVEALKYLYRNNPPANTQFLPFFIPGMIITIAVIIVPMVVLYRRK